MAKAVGQIEPSECKLMLTDAGGGAHYDEDEPCYMYVVFRLPPLPYDWTDSDSDGHVKTPASEMCGGYGWNLLPQRLKVNREYFKDEATDHLHEAIYTVDQNSPSHGPTAYASAADPPTWMTAHEDTDYQRMAMRFTSYGGGGDENLPLVGVAEFKFWCENAGATGLLDVSAVDIETVIDNEPAYNIEWINRGADRLYQENDPMTSFLVMNVLIDGYNKMLSENRPHFSIPLCGNMWT